MKSYKVKKEFPFFENDKTYNEHFNLLSVDLDGTLLRCKLLPIY